MIENNKYEAVIGLEVHIQLLTHSKIFCGDGTTFGVAPNTLISPLTMALPGTLPKLNKAVIDKAIKLGLACNCNITELNYFDRKNYFYADLPKGYQISQNSTPICVGGFLPIDIDGVKKNIALTRIHLEEDAGKNNHELDPDYSLIDLNRAGMPLLELVSEPVIHNSNEAYVFLTDLRRLVRYLEICDGNMEEGSMRCDANISIRLKGESVLNTRVEVKNMNSIRNVKKAIDIEIKRQIDLIESGGKVEQQTRGFDPIKNITIEQRSKEFAHDYRYFPEPDMPPFVITKKKIDTIKEIMPPLPNELYLKFTNEFGLSHQDAIALIDEKDIALYFLELTKATKNYKSAANWILGEIKAYLNEKNLQIADFKISASQIADIIKNTDLGVISSSSAKKVFEALLLDKNTSVQTLLSTLNITQTSDDESIRVWAKEAIQNNPQKAEEYKKGKKGLIAMFIGDVMKISKGKADPKLTAKIVAEELNN
jgi:aspartyl-tRNA(Asn)/glutamyl-tRNA(Gln) amidotransferase subunit B